MKIGLVCPYNIFKGGGVQECVKAMQSELIKRGHEVLIITPRPRLVSAGNDEDGIIFIGNATDIKSPFHTTGQISGTVNYRMIDDILKSYKFDILHFHEPWVPILSRQILSRSTSKNVATFHAKLPETVVSRTIELVITPYTKSILKYLDSLTAVSDAAAEYVKILSNKEVSIIPNGIDLDKYRSINLKESVEKENTILFIGRLERRKGVKYLIRAFAELSKTNKNIKLIIAGDGPDRNKLELLVKSLGASNVTFTGYVDEAMKHKLLASCSVFCSPALFGESFGIVLLEAMAYGVPIVAGNNPGYVGVLKERGQLSLVNPKDIPEFSRRLGMMMFDPELIDSWKNWSKDYVKQFSYQKIVDGYENLYKKIVKVK